MTNDAVNTDYASRGIDALKLWKHIFGDLTGLLCVYTVKGEWVNGKYHHPPNAIAQKYFEYPREATRAAQWALEESDRGRDAYYCVHQLSDGRRIKANAADIQALWQEDITDEILESADVPPTAVVASSPDSHHCYLRLTKAISPEVAEDLNERWTHSTRGADKGGWDLSQILRVPGTRNHKYPEKPIVTLRWINSNEHDPNTLDSQLPKVERKKKKREYKPGEGEITPPVKLQGHDLEVWRGEHPVITAEGNEDRSATLVKIAGVLYRNGLMNETAMVASLEERDKTLGYEKYSIRGDSEIRYAEIFDQVEDASIHFTDWQSFKGMYSENGGSANSANSYFHKSSVTPHFPVEVMPASTRRFIWEQAKAIDCSVDFVAMGVLGSQSAAIGHSRRAQYKRSYSQSAALYLAVVGDPGTAKSPAVSLATNPVKRYQRQLKTTYDEEKREYEDEKRKYEALSKAQKAKTRPPNKPLFPRTWADDTTIEVLSKRLNENPRGLFLIQDEMTGWILSFDQYKSGGKGDTRQKYLKMWSNETIAVDRKGEDDPLIVEHPFVTLLGGIQPQRLGDLADDRGDGFFDRFLVAYPEFRACRETDDDVSLEAQRSYEDLIERLYRLEMDNEGGPILYTFTSEAREVYKKHSNRLSDDQENGGLPPVLRNALSKLKAYLIRLSLILAVCREVEALGEVSRQITQEDVERAAVLVEYFKNMAHKVHGHINSYDTRTKVAFKLTNLLRGNDGVLKGSATEFQEMLSPDAPDTPEATSRLLRRIAKEEEHIELEDGWRHDGRILIIKLLEKTVGTVGSEQSNGHKDEGVPACEYPGCNNPKEVWHGFTVAGCKIHSDQMSESDYDDNDEGDAYDW